MSDRCCGTCWFWDEFEDIPGRGVCTHSVVRTRSSRPVVRTVESDTSMHHMEGWLCADWTRTPDQDRLNRFHQVPDTFAPGVLP